MDVFCRHRLCCLFCRLCLGNSQPSSSWPRTNIGFRAQHRRQIILDSRFDLQPSLKGSLLELKPLQAKDFESLFQAASDPMIWEQHPQSTRYQKDVFEKFFAGAMASGGAFAIVDIETQEVIGSSRYYGHDLTKNQILIGYTFLKKEYWGGRYNWDLKKTMLVHAFKFVDAVLFEVGEFNTRSRKAMEKIGGHLIGQACLDEKNHLIFEITKDRFKEKFAEQ